jgi:hypothetical protein
VIPALLLLACQPAAEDVARAIGSQNPVMREDGAKIAQNYDDPVVVEALLKVIGDPSEPVRLNAIESLAELEATAAGPALIERLRTDESAKVRSAAADALGRLKIAAAVPDLVAYVESFPPSDRGLLAGAWALGHIGAEGLSPELKQSTLDCLVALRNSTPDKYIRYTATAALRTLK